MLSKQEYIRLSIENNLFFQRIIKEHLFFIETNLPTVESVNISRADMLKRNFEQLLAETTFYAKWFVSEQAIKSNEFVTPYTLRAEELSAKLTGATLNTEITKAELSLFNVPSRCTTEHLEAIINDLNKRSIILVKQVIDFQNKLLFLLSESQLFITLYNEMLEHLNHESEYYLRLLESLQNKSLSKKQLCRELNFWNHIMENHAQFITGMLDPTEINLKEIAETIAKEFETLIKICLQTPEKEILNMSLEAVTEIRNFKEEATKQILSCKIKSIILPLLADHVLREANHYIKLLNTIK